MSQMKIVALFVVLLAGVFGVKKLRNHRAAEILRASAPSIAAGHVGPADEPFGKISGAPIVLTDVNAQPVNIPSDKPQLIVFWGPNCGYSKRSMALLQRLDREYSGGQIETLGLYPNLITDVALKASQHSHGYDGVRVAAAQRDMATMQRIVDTFHIRGTGSDMYVVSRNGTLYRIEARDAQSTAIEMITRGTLEKSLNEL